MTQVMKGVRVLEVAQFTFVPSAGGVLSDWGAEVIKIEHPVRGDGQRGLQVMQRMALNPKRQATLHHSNRGKKSVGLDIGSPDGLELLYEIAKSCDVFLTNFLPSARKKLGIDMEDLRKVNPNIIYARGTALGDKGPERENGGFDQTAFWSRAGAARLVTPKELEVPLGMPGPAFGDTISGMFVAGGIAAALFHREKTGEACEVDVSLLSAGVWATGMATDVCLDLNASIFENPMPKSGAMPEGSMNPFMGTFRTADDRAINLVVLQPGPYIADTFQHLNLEHLIEDERFSTVEQLMRNAAECAPYIAASFAEHPLPYWRERLQTMKGQWAVVQDPLEVGEDPQVLANGMIYEVDMGDGNKPLKLVANPVQFDRQPVQNTRGPEANEHTELFLMELGLDWDRIADLKEKGAIA